MKGRSRFSAKKGFEETTISEICRAANISDATLYEYFSSKEEVLFSIAKLYTQRELERMKEFDRYIHSPREKLRVIIQAYLEFYENNRLYTSVALLVLKGNRKFIKSDAYQVVRESARSIVEAVHQGITEGVFRDDLDPYIVRNMILGFIEHLTIQWLLIGRPRQISGYRDIIYDMAMRAIEKDENDQWIEIKCKTVGPNNGTH